MKQWLIEEATMPGKDPSREFSVAFDRPGTIEHMPAQREPVSGRV
jgi:hypothetical protein